MNEICFSGWELLGLTIFIMTVGYFVYMFMIELVKEIKRREDK